jgi:hypothetical protein
VILFVYLKNKIAQLVEKEDEQAKTGGKIFLISI